MGASLLAFITIIHVIPMHKSHNCYLKEHFTLHSKLPPNPWHWHYFSYQWLSHFVHNPDKSVVIGEACAY